MIQFAADYFDGRSARRVPVHITVSGGRAVLAGEGVAAEFPSAAVTVIPRIGKAPYRLEFPDGAAAVTQAFAEVEQAFALAGRRTLAHRLESHLGFVVVCVVALIVIGWAGHQYGVPRAAEQIARNLPEGLETKLGEESLKAMDGFVLRPTKLPAERREQVTRLFDGLRGAARMPADVRLVFRNGNWIDANAMALPGGIIVVTDELVELMKTDDQLAAVLAHEMGHLSQRHSLRNLLQDSIVGLVTMAVYGDASSVAGLAVTVPTVLLHTSYSRDFEREADAFAFDVLKKTGRSPRELGTALELLESAHSESDKKPADGAAPAKRDKRARELGYFSTHPPTEERARAAEEAAR